MKSFPLFCVVLCLLIACSDVPLAAPTVIPPSQEIALATAVPTNTAAPPTITPISTITSTPTPTQTPTATPTATPTFVPVSAGTAVPQPHTAIVPENASQVAELARWGRGVIQSIQYSSDGQKIIVQTESGIYVHNADDLSELSRIPTLTADDDNYSTSDIPDVPPEFEGEVLAFSPDKTLIALSDDNVVTIYSFPSFEVVSTVIPSETTTPEEKSWHDYSRDVRTMTFTPDASYLAVGMQPSAYVTQGGSAIEIFRVSDGQMTMQLRQSNIYDSLLDFACDERYNAEPPGPTPVEEIAFSPDGRFLAASFVTDFRPTRVRLYQADNGTFIHEFDPGIEKFSFSPDSQTVATGSPSGDVQLWRASDGTLLQTINGYDAVTTELVFGMDGQLMAAQSAIGISLHQTTNGTVLNQFPLATAISFATTNRLYAVGYADGTVEWRSVEDSRVLAQVTAHTSRVAALAFVPGSEELLSSGSDCAWYAWKMGELEQTFPPYLSPSIYNAPAASTGIRKIVSLPDGETVAVLFSSFPSDFREHPDLGFASLKDGTFINFSDNFRTSLKYVVFSLNGTYLALDNGLLSVAKISRNFDFIQLWNLERYMDWQMAFSPNEQLLAAGSQIFLSENGALVAELPIQYRYDEISSMTFSPDGRFLAIGTTDGLIRLWGIP